MQHRAVVLEWRSDRCARDCIPHPCCLVKACRNDLLAVRTELGISNPAIMLEWRGNRVGIRRIPNPCSSVEACRYDPAAVRTELGTAQAGLVEPDLKKAGALLEDCRQPKAVDLLTGRISPFHAQC